MLLVSLLNCLLILDVGSSADMCLALLWVIGLCVLRCFVFTLAFVAAFIIGGCCKLFALLVVCV